MMIRSLRPLLISSALLGGRLLAANIAWDVAPGTVGAGDSAITGGTGTWNLVNGGWTADSGVNNLAWDNTANAADIAVFGGVAGTVTLDNGGSAVNAGGILVSTGGYTVASATASDTLRFGSAQGQITSSAIGANAIASISAHLAGTGGLTVAASGDLTDSGGGNGGRLDNSGDNTGLTGGITVTAGLVRFSGRSAAGSNTITLNGGGIVVTDASDPMLANAVVFGASGATLRAYGTRTLTLQGAVSGSGALRKSDGGTVVLQGVATYTGATTVGAGRLVIDNAASTIGTLSAGTALNGGAVLDLRNGTLNASQVWMNASTVTMSGGTLNVGANNLKVGNSAGTAVFTQTGGTVTHSSTVYIADSGSTAIGTVALGGGSFTTSATMLVATRGTGTLTIGGTANVTANVLWFGHNTATPAGANGTVNLDGGTFTLGGFQKPGTQASTGTLNFNGGLVKASADNAYFVFGNSTNTALASGLTHFRTNVRNGGVKIDTNGFNIGIGAALLHSDVGGDNAIDGGLTKSGAGTLTLSAANAYTGATAVSAGTLAVTGTVAINGASGVTVASGATLALSGTLLATSASDTLSNAGTLVLGGALNLNGKFDAFNGGATGSYLLITSGAAGVSGNFASVTGYDTGTWSSVVLDNATGNLVFTAVPEPSAYGLLGAGLSAGFAGMRRRGKRA